MYSVGGAITQPWMRKTIKQALQQYGAMIEEVLPVELMERHGSCLAVRRCCTFTSRVIYAEGCEARRRMVYEELFLFQLKLQAYRALNRKRDGWHRPSD